MHEPKYRSLRTGEITVKDLSKELIRLAKMLRNADFDPETIAKTENTGPDLEDNIKNKATFDWIADFDSQQGEVKVPSDTKGVNYNQAVSDAASAYSGKMNNLLFKGSRSNPFSDIVDDLLRIAKGIEADFNPETIAQTENTGPNLEDNIKNKVTFNWLAEFERQQKSPEGTEDQ